MATLNEQLVERAKEWASLNIVYEHRGVTRNGCDCTGLIIGIMRELGHFRSYVLRRYPPDWNLHAMADNHIDEELQKVADEVDKNETQPGDIVTFTFGRCRTAHVGIAIGNGVFIHTYKTAGKIGCGMLVNSEWSSRWTKTYRLNLNKVRAYD